MICRQRGRYSPFIIAPSLAGRGRISAISFSEKAHLLIHIPQGDGFACAVLYETFRITYRNEYSQSEVESQGLTTKKKTLYNSEEKRFAATNLEQRGKLSSGNYYCRCRQTSRSNGQHRFLHPQWETACLRAGAGQGLTGH